MAKAVTIEEFHVTMRVRHGLREREYRMIRRTLASEYFRRRLHGAVAGVVRERPSLLYVRVTLSW